MHKMHKTLHPCARHMHGRDPSGRRRHQQCVRSSSWSPLGPSRRRFGRSFSRRCCIITSPTMSPGCTPSSPAMLFGDSFDVAVVAAAARRAKTLAVLVLVRLQMQMQMQMQRLATQCHTANDTSTDTVTPAPASTKRPCPASPTTRRTPSPRRSPTASSGCTSPRPDRPSRPPCGPSPAPGAGASTCPSPTTSADRRRCRGRRAFCSMIYMVSPFRLSCSSSLCVCVHVPAYMLIVIYIPAHMLD